MTENTNIFKKWIFKGNNIIHKWVKGKKAHALAKREAHEKAAQKMLVPIYHQLFPNKNITQKISHRGLRIMIDKIDQKLSFLAKPDQIYPKATAHKYDSIYYKIENHLKKAESTTEEIEKLEQNYPVSPH